MYATEQSVLNTQWNAALQADINERAKGTPAAVYRPKIYIDGDAWCALYGENLQDGVAGFGSSPEKAMLAFNEAWIKDLSQRATEKCLK